MVTIYNLTYIMLLEACSYWSAGNTTLISAPINDHFIEHLWIKDMYNLFPTKKKKKKK